MDNIYAKEQAFLMIVFGVIKSYKKWKMFVLQYIAKRMVYCDTRIVSFYTAIYWLTGIITHPNVLTI